MSTSEATLGSTPDVSSSVAVSETAASSPAQATTDTSSADVQSQKSVQDTQSSQTQTETDPLEGFPADAELQAAIANKTPFAEMAARIKAAYEPLKTKYADIESKYAIFQPHAEKFSAPEELQSLVQMRENLLGWEKGDNGQLIPSTQKFVETLDPQRREFLFADLADGTTLDPRTGQQISRMDKALQFVATDPERRASAAKILGLVEPSAVAPQWQATEEQLNAIAVDPANPTPADKELQEIFRSLPYDEREQLYTNDPDFIRKQLGREKLTRQLEAATQQTAQREQQQAQQYEQTLHAEAQKAGDENVRSQLSEALTTFRKSVVDQCKLIAPLDPSNPPQGMDAQAIAQYNQQAEASNKSEAATVVGLVVGLINQETRPFVLPLLQEIGVIDDKFLAELDNAAKGFGDNARNYGHLTHRQKLQANGNGYQPGQDVTMLSNEAQRNRKLLSYYANQLSGRLLEKKGQTFGMKATGHNNILNGVATSRPNANGGSYDPTKATTPQPAGKMTREEIDRLYG